MRISDWSSDVCSSDLDFAAQFQLGHGTQCAQHAGGAAHVVFHFVHVGGRLERNAAGVKGNAFADQDDGCLAVLGRCLGARRRSEEHTSELQSLMRISYAVFCLNKKKQTTKTLQ